MSHHPYLTLEQATRARELRRREGLSWPVLAARFGVSLATIKAAVNRLEAVEADRAGQAKT